ncbi:MAG: S8 family peptidase [Lachnospiraceae bacterium]|nr:S8 family peptidase [Lachnospiraceae bacterium]
MDRVRKMVFCDELYKRGVRGKGVTVAVLDSGIYGHIDFDHRIKVFKDFIQDKKNIYDDFGHGTHVAGVLAGDGRASIGTYRGIAPECNLVILKILNDIGEGNAENLINAIYWVLRHREELNIQVMNISIGLVESSDLKKKESIMKATEEAWNSGIVVVAAAGNAGPLDETITAPGLCERVITVGCANDTIPYNGQYGMCSNYTGRGSMKSKILKPDIIAPGSNVISCGSEKLHKYVKMSGTSMSTPVISGACALLLGEYPKLKNEEVKRIIKRATNDCGLPRTIQGNGMINFTKLGI